MIGCYNKEVLLIMGVSIIKKRVIFTVVFLIIFGTIFSQSKEIEAFYMNNFHNFEEPSMSIDFNSENQIYEKVIDIEALNYQNFYLDDLTADILISIEDVSKDSNYSLILEDDQGNQVYFEDCKGPSKITLPKLDLEKSYKLVLLNGTQNINGKLIITVQ